MSEKFIKFKMSQVYFDLVAVRPTAFALLSLIATRARRTNNKANGLKTGEAYIGDYKKYGVSRQIYRSDVTCLKSTNQITTKTTNRGTVAKLVGTDIFDLNITDSNQRINQPTNNLATNKQPLTNNVIKNVIKKENIKRNFLTPEALTESDFTEIAAKYRITPEAVKDTFEGLTLWVKSTGKTYKDYKAALMNWLRRRIEKKEISKLLTADEAFAERMKTENPEAYKQIYAK